MIDTHVHLNMPDFESDLEEVIARANRAGVSSMICVGFDVASSKKAVELSLKFDCLYSAVGVHPHDAQKFGKDTLKTLRSLAKEKKVKAIGETGLDYYRNLSGVEEQKRTFIDHINLARELNLPLIIHMREAYNDVLEIIRAESDGVLKGVFHCFPGDAAAVEKVTSMGFYVSFGGIITFLKADQARSALKAAPLEKLIMETDCPYLTPVPFRGKRNEPAYIKFVVEKTAEIKELSSTEVSKITTENAEKLFSI